MMLLVGTASLILLLTDDNNTIVIVYDEEDILINSFGAQFFLQFFAKALWTVVNLISGACCT